SLHVGAPAQFISNSEVDIRTADAAFLLLHIRVVAPPSPFAVLYWRSLPSDPDSVARSSPLVMLPDGYWHLYAVPLHALPGWTSTPRVHSAASSASPRGWSGAGSALG